MKKITDVDISGAARRTGLIGPGATVANVSNLRSFLKSLDIPVEDRNPFEKVPPAHLNLEPAGVGAGANI